ncbi:L-threonylcarbamoyladenylate synthase type 1 TsaC [Rahnella variigena]|jgi:L-threonylcarbamoyladenylate synthase|uniref:Threonylcarbamoyl-AMP synthase n=1 Tax=Rahnella variigena TaxID=574964 RepID=A0ABX9PSV8_9GAMM|nr:L-threonylcarbamoyladenylate synthase type 1 TsaC [Rahnella variigena]MDH2899162.1 L-threonylcarbamoyladenylate synthase type 1 TsaC [Rahnella variigena]RJT49005.1 L-threonylcarbamoyladenylate synthase type 1 TsaC [Rahnella variigena]RKF67122.1 L-threonylcarbamoyladenylate synthase type 1 TsaC [Rahnella variigena]
MNKSLENSFTLVLDALREQQVVAYPTEAVFGLGCDPDSEQAVDALLALKKRPKDKGLILIADNYQQLLPYIDDSSLTEQQLAHICSFWPGPVTWVMPAKPSTPEWLTGRFTSLAVRVTDHPLVKELCQKFGKPLVSTSANLNGEPPCRLPAEVRLQFGDNFPVIDGDVGGRENPSEIRDALTGNLIRQG